MASFIETITGIYVNLDYVKTVEPTVENDGFILYTNDEDAEAYEVSTEEWTKYFEAQK